MCGDELEACKRERCWAVLKEYPMICLANVEMLSYYSWSRFGIWRQDLQNFKEHFQSLYYKTGKSRLELNTYAAINFLGQYLSMDILTDVLTYLLTYLLKLRSRVLFEKIIGSHPVKKNPLIDGTRRFITASTRARHLSPSWASSLQSMPLHSNSWWSILILFSHLLLDLPSGLCQVSLPKPCIHLSSPHTCYMPRPSHASRFVHSNDIWWSLSFSVCSFLHSPIPLSLLGPNILKKQFQPTFLP